MSEPTFTDADRMREVAAIRADYVDKYVTRRIDHRDGDCTSAEITEWENQAYRLWGAQYPALNALLPTHLHDGSEAVAQ